jgi:ABC-type transporter Mla subunit MlaD
MSTAVMNQLLEEGVTRSRELSDASDEALRAIDGAAREAEELTQRLETGTAEARQHIQEIVSRLERSEAALEAAGNEAEGALAGLSGKAGEVAAAAAELLDRVTKSLVELETQREAAESDLTTRMTGAQDEATELAGKTQAAATAAEEGLEQVAQTLDAFRTAIEAARTELGQKQEAWSAAADELYGQAFAHAEAWTSGLIDLLERQSTAMVEAANGMVDEHNQSMEGIRTRFVEQAPQHVGEALEPLESELAELGQAAQTLEQELSAEAGRLGQWADAAVPLVDGVQAALLAAAME